MFLYVISNTQYIKIGIAQDVKSRLSTLQVGSTQPLSVIFKLDCKAQTYARKLEKLLHKRYKSRLVSGEWFDVPVPVIARDLLFLRDAAEIFSMGVYREKTAKDILGGMTKELLLDYIEMRWPKLKPVIPSSMLPSLGHENWTEIPLEQQERMWNLTLNMGHKLQPHEFDAIESYVASIAKPYPYKSFAERWMERRRYYLRERKDV